ncbi:MAG: hypothetical protein AB8B96_10835 [Lysobacterales bacterium]
MTTMRPIFFLLFFALACDGNAGTRDVATPGELIAAIDSALPGDVITLLPGTYGISATRISVSRSGTSSQPITVRAPALGDALIRWDSAGSFVEGFLISAPWWRFENLDIEGVCSNDSDCEHAFHVVGGADSTILRGNRLHGFNAMLKANGSSGEFPDDVLVERNELFNAAPRNTANPVTPIDVVGGRRWVVRGNTIYDFAKGGGNQISYAAFLKGNSKDGLIERNLVICERFHSGQVRLGLSLGGGGTGPDSICEDLSCSPEHEGGIVRNNLVINCPADVGIYLNEAASSQVHHNTLYNNTGIDVRFAASSVDLRNNLLSGEIRNRNGGTSTEVDNLENLSNAQMESWFADPANGDFSLLDGAALVDQGMALNSVERDYCGVLRGNPLVDLGALEYSRSGQCDTTVGGGRSQIFADGFE